MLTPSKQTATQLKGRMKDQEAAENTALKTQRRFRKPTFVQVQHQGVEYGSVMHAVMQHICYEACEDIEGVRREVMRLVQNRLISEEQADMVACDQIVAFFTTKLGYLLRSSRDVLREFKFSILNDGSYYVPGMKGEKVLLQGVVDCALMEPDGITVIDFKTDYVTEETLPQVVERYRVQVMAYADALERIYRRPIKSALLYFFHINRFVSMQ